MKLICLLLFIPFISEAQSSLKGKVIDVKTKKGISFATIGLVKENTGNNTDSNGRFEITSVIVNDTLVISSVGYESKRIPVEFFIGDNSIELNEKYLLHRPVIITSKTNWTSVSLNEFSKCENLGIVSAGYQTQLAQHLQSPADNSMLTDLEICLRVSNFGKENSRFRIRVYDMDSLTGKPGNDLCDEVIELSSTKRRLRINIEPYRIFIPHKDFFVAIEWLKIPENADLPTQKSPKMNQIVYRPSISIRNRESTELKVWMLDYRNNWRIMNGGKIVSCISAKLKY